MNYSKFIFSNIVSVCYNVISKSETNSFFIDSSNNIINDYVITLEKFEEAVNKLCGDAKFLASCVIDVFIDRGMMVPAIVHSKKGIIRAYKMGEYSKLTRTQLDSFISMLYEYQEYIDDDLGKTEFEKLCVLYFNNAISQGFFPQQANYEDDCYSVCYSLFGPRVTEGKISYKVDSDYTLIAKFCDHKSQYVKFNANGQIYITTSIRIPSRISFFKTGFAYKYSRIRQMFVSNPNLNIYVNTYTRFLTLKAIGNNKKNQYLSICAELYQITKLSNGLFFQDKEDLLASDSRILEGINSGLWKYWCYKNDALNKTNLDIFKKDSDVGAFLSLESEPSFDKSRDWDSSIDSAAIILFNTAFLIDAVFKAKGIKSNFNNLNLIFKNGIGIFGTNQIIADYFNARYQYYKCSFVNNQLSVEELVRNASKELLNLSLEARRHLDFCDNVLEKSSAHFTSYKMLLIVFSTEEEFPPIVFDKLNELLFEGIGNDKYCRVYGVSDEVLDLSRLIADNNSLIESRKLKLCTYDCSKISKIRCVEGKVKDSSIAKIINKIIDNYDEGLSRIGLEPQNFSIPCGDNSLVLTPISGNGFSINQSSQIIKSLDNGCSTNAYNIALYLNQSTLNIGTIDSIGKAAFIEVSGKANNINFD